VVPKTKDPLNISCHFLLGERILFLFKIMEGTSGLCTMMHSLVHYNVSLAIGVMITEKKILKETLPIT
jgi:hypothetical protein